jgi:hypothetical protein
LSFDPAERRQTDRERQRFWQEFAERHPRPPLAWGNTYARWREVPGTELVVSYNIARRGVGVFVRGQRGIPVAETAAQLARFSLEVRLGCDLGNPNFAFLSWVRLDMLEEANWPQAHDWLFEAGNRYAAALAEVVGGLA